MRRDSKRKWCSFVLAATVAACGGDSSSGEPPSEPEAAPTEFGGDRPTTLLLPDNYDPDTPAPLLILLHGYSASGLVQDLYFDFKTPAAAQGMLFLRPDGTINSEGLRFWNAFEACCDFNGSGVDDVAYIKGLIDEVSAHYRVDPKRIYLSGHSNGHYMAYRMACEHPETIAAIAGLAGAMPHDADQRCKPAESLHVLHIHGTNDDLVDYNGGPKYLGAEASTDWWAKHSGCSAAQAGEDIDLDQDVAGAETRVSNYDTGCQAGSSAALWTIQDGSHIPGVGGVFGTRMVDYLLSKSKAE